MTIDFDDMIEDVFPVLEEPTNDDPITDPVIETPVEDPIVEDPQPTTDVDDDSTEDPVAKEYYEFLKEYGVLSTPDDFEFDGTPEKLQQALDLTRESLKETTARSLWETLPEDFKPLLQYALAGGKSLDDYMEAYAQPDYTTLDLSNPDNQRRVMYDY